MKDRDSSVGKALGYGLDDRGSRVRFLAGAGNVLFSTASRTALGPTKPPIQWVLGALSVGVKRPGREAFYSPPSSAEVKESVELYLHSPNTPSWRSPELKHRDNFTVTFIYIYEIFEIFTEVKIQVTPYSFVIGYHRFGGSLKMQAQPRRTRLV
jgi:hypothetical protein